MRITVFLLAGFLFVAMQQCPARTRYVTVSGAGLMDGTSWNNAFSGISLQAAIDSSSTGDEVWVATGTYFTTNSGNRDIYFHMVNGVALYGSFIGTETSVTQRIFSCGVSSVLSAEIGAPGPADNSYHVISNGNLDATAIIDGFVISDANDNRVPILTEGLGGGIYNNGMNSGNNSSPTIRNCIIRNNSAVFGAGIFNNGYNGGNANPVISNCIITGNTATNAGGGIDNFGLAGNASPSIINCIISNNSALVAGGMYCWGGNPGGNSSPVVLNAVFANNAATAGDAGGVMADNSNSAGIFNDGTSNPIFRNTIFKNNTAAGNGPQFAIKGTGTFVAVYSSVDSSGQFPPHIISGPGTGNIFSDPLFANIADVDGEDNCWLTADDGLLLQVNSPAIDAGDNTGTPALDIRFFNRIQNGVVDMGAYETNLTVLPLTWLTFTGKKERNGILLQWTTVNEMNTSHFVVEKSSDGRFFLEIDTVVALNNTEQHAYNYTDINPFPYTTSYRIKQVDKDNRFSFSAVIVLKQQAYQIVKKLLNPIHQGFLFAELNQPDPRTALSGCWRLYDMTGKSVASGTITSKTINENIESLATGMYVLEISVGKQIERRKMLVH